MVKVNGIPTACSGDCKFEWSSSSSPTVTGITPTSGRQRLNVLTCNYINIFLTAFLVYVLIFLTAFLVYVVFFIKNSKLNL